MDSQGLAPTPNSHMLQTFVAAATTSPGALGTSVFPARSDRYDQMLVSSKCRCLEAVVAATFRLPVEDLRSASRGEAQIAFARQVAMYVAHVWFALSLTEVGRRFDRDRTTVAHACRVVEDRRDDPRIDRVVAAVESAAELWYRLPQSAEAER